MTKPNFTYVAVVMDESGSMANVRAETLGGLNTFIADQKKQPGECVMTLRKFNTFVPEPVFRNRDIQGIEPLTEEDYSPNGMTALYDAVGKTIDEVGQDLAKLPEHERPSQVIVIIQTDGQENNSVEYPIWGNGLMKIKDKIEHQKTKYSWDFVFMGADIDAFATAGALGINAKSTLDYSKHKTMDSFTALNNYVSSSRLYGHENTSFSNTDRANAGT